MNSIFGLTIKNLETYLESNNEKKYIASILYEWIYKKQVLSFDLMSNVSKTLREKLNNDFTLNTLEIKDRLAGQDTVKYLFKLSDGALIETVLMKHNYGNSICVSSQVGCDMGCAFCASGVLKKVRNLEVSELVNQVMTIIHNEKIRIDSVVVMGIGEPMLNYDNVLNFIKIINNPKGLEIGARHITLSTCGIIPGIEALSKERMQVNLAWSLHAPDDATRNKIMPINKAYPISKVISALKSYITVTNRRVTIEYVMISNINDSEKDAINLAKLLKGMNVYVNLIPLNEIAENGFKKSDEKTIMNFYDTLKKNHINVTVRREYGGNINAACGQLRANEVRK